jgi:exonuclease III
MQQKTAGFTKEERRDFGQLLESGFVDTVRLSPLLPPQLRPINCGRSPPHVFCVFWEQFRHQNPDLQQFTYWSNRFNCRAKNLGSSFLFLISYFLFLISYFLFLISYFLFLISYFLFNNK